MHLRKTLAAIFSPTWRLIGPDPATLRRGGPLGALEWVVPRAECHYRRLDFAALPARQRPAAARIAAARHEPVSGASVCIAWTGPVAHVWYWPQPQPSAGDEETRWIPETLLRAPPATDGPRLLRLLRGFEGQLWRERHLVCSQWWPQLPDLEEWRRFLRACGLGTEDLRAVPEPVTEPWAETPWADLRRGLFGSPAAVERLAWTGGLAALALVLGWQLAAQATWAAAHRDLQARIETLRARATPLLDARERAEAARQALEEFSSFQRGVNDYALMAEIAARLPKDSRFAAWHREGARLQVSVRSPDADPRHFVAAFDKHPRLADVVATPAEAGVMRLDFTLPGGPAPEPRQ